MAAKKSGTSRAMMNAAHDTYYARSSMDRYGPIQHARAVAQVLLESGAASDEADAVRKAAVELEHQDRLAKGTMINRAARLVLDKEGQADVAERRRRYLANLLPTSVPV